MVYFESGGFIELFDPIPKGFRAVLMRAAAGVGRVADTGRLGRWVHTPGLCDFAIETAEDLGVALAGLQNAPKRTAVKDMQRRQHDDTVTHWQVSAPKDPRLPFYIGPYNPAPSLPADARQHSNGIRSLTGMTVETPEPDMFVESMCAMSGARYSGQRVELDDFSIQVRQGLSHRLVELTCDDAPPAGFRVTRFASRC